MLCSHTAKSGRKDGVLSVGRFVVKNGKTSFIKWVRNLPINTGFFAYSSLAVLNDGSVGVLYEDEPSSHIVFKTFSKAELFD